MKRKLVGIIVIDISLKISLSLGQRYRGMIYWLHKACEFLGTKNRKFCVFAIVGCTKLDNFLAEKIEIFSYLLLKNGHFLYNYLYNYL